MNTIFLLISLTTIASAIAAMSLRNLVHCVLCLTLTFVGISLTYLQLSSQFIGFAQVMVYVGAVSILIIFALLMTRSGHELTLREWRPMHWVWGTLITFGLLACLGLSITGSSVSGKVASPEKSESVKALGQALMQEYLLPLEAMALLLTVALIGAALVALPASHQAPTSKGGNE